MDTKTESITKLRVIFSYGIEYFLSCSFIKLYFTVDKKEIPVTENDTYITVNRQTENRLDVVANIVYGFAPYWWIIAMANDIIDPFDVPCGTVLRCPPLVSLYSDGSVLS